ncbi:MAG: choice-of-anchor tandem repeat GloVer-containing protein, partial [Salinivirgaceae bacterium]
MKTKLLLLSVAISMLLSVGYSQTQFWGTFPGSGVAKTGMNGETGKIFKTDSVGKNLTIEYEFSSMGGQSPTYTKLCEANNGKLYGLTSSGGSNNFGVIFEFDPISNDYKIKFEFGGASGESPKGSLVKAPNGLLYGTTSIGGTIGSGVIFEYDPYKNEYTKKFDLGAAYGQNPYGSLTLADNGKLYGMASNGGNGSGVIFEFDTKSGIYNKKVDFFGSNGANPYGDLIKATNGKLYGMTTFGGGTYGTLFEYNAGADTVKTNVNFGGIGGEYPYGSLMLSSTGKLYGMASSGGLYGAGIVFEYDITGDSNIVKYNFKYGSSGSYPYGNLMEDSTHRFYGMTNSEGAYMVGTLFEFLPATDTCIVKANFNYANGGGSYPYGTLMQASNNKIYGLTSSGGTTGFSGVLFEYDSSNDTIIKIVDLDISKGINPQAGLLRAADGKFYGTTQNGGLYGFGVIYEYDPNSRIYSKLFDFNNSTSGGNCFGGLMQASNGSLFGMTDQGGQYSYGVLYEFKIPTKTFIKRHEFNDTTGAYPKGELIEGLTGKLYGMTNSGGSKTKGVLFEYVIADSSYAVKVNFNDTTTGGYPNGNLLKANNDTLYGMTKSGGLYYSGTLFDFNMTTGIFNVRVNFDGLNISTPYGSLIQASNDTLYGLSYGGGIGNGTLFSYNINSRKATKKVDFDWSTIGAYPTGDLMEANNGKLYGMTEMGGTNGNGVLFEYNIALDTLIVTDNLLVTTGSSQGSLIEVGCNTIFETVYSNICYGEIYTFGTQSLTNPGTYSETFISATGCDSIVTLHLIIDCPSKAEYWGTTLAGGANGLGTIYTVDEKGENHILKYSFEAGPKGNSPYGGLIQADNGKLYGMTAFGGTNGNGVIYEYNPKLKSYTKKFEFDGMVNGANPKGDLVKAPNGKLYGMTELGGFNNEGVLFEYDPDSNLFVKKGDFDSLPSGANPLGSLLLVNDSLLYGMTRFGGVNGSGVIFKYNFINETFNKMLDFSQFTTGSQPVGSLLQANNGLLYGVTSKGGMNDFGKLFEFNTLSYQCSSKHEFYDLFSGAYPQGRLVQANNGKLYGLTESGGTNNSGTLFEYDFYTNMFYTKANFDSTLNGKKPTGSLTLSKTGNLLGGASYGGASNKGVLFEFNFGNDSIANKHNFNGTNGQSPLFGSLLFVDKYPIYDTIYATICNGESYYLGIQPYTVAGNYISKLESTSGVDSTVILYLSVNPSYSVPKIDSICQGSSYVFGSQTLTTAGTYNENFPTIYGCDSIVTLTLSLKPVYKDTLVVSICKGETYNLGSQIIDSTGVFTEVLVTAAGCDSTIVVNLTVIPKILSNINVSICQGGSYSFGGNALTVSGTYKDTVPSVNTGCDSIITLTLNVNPIILKNINASICQGDSYSFGGNALTVSGTYKDTVPSVNTGCDSIVTLTLNVNPIYSDTLTATICKGDIYILGTQSITEAGTYVEAFPSQLGCDSIVTVMLNVDSLPTKPSIPIGDINVNNTGDTSTYTTTPVANADSYNWSILPINAGVISGTGNTSSIDWSPTYFGIAKIVVRGVNNCGFGPFSDTLLVTVTSIPVALFTYSATGLIVTFDNLSQNGDKYNWYFGDGYQSSDFEPIHTYSYPDFYNVCLTVTDTVSLQSANYCSEIMVGDTNLVCKASFSYTQNADSVSFINTSLSEFTAFNWDFGDGTYSNLENPVHKYTKGGYYLVSMTGFDSNTGCSNTAIQELFIDLGQTEDCNANFKVIINGANATFVNLSLGSFTDVLWSFGDNQYSTSTDSIAHKYSKSGFYQACISIYDSISGCMDEYCSEVLIDLNQGAMCKADYSYFVSGASVSFSSKATGNITDYMWDFGDGSYAFIANFDHTYSKPGFYKVNFTVLDSVTDCTSSITKTVVVTQGAENLCQAQFTYFITGNSVVFSNSSNGNYTDAFWDYGDGNFSTDIDESHVYAKPGFYSVTLTIYDAINNCLSETTNVLAITSEQEAICKADYTFMVTDKIVTFQNNSIGEAAEFFWDFGDGLYGFEENPKHTYDASGYYEVSLSTYDNLNDCFDEKSGIVFVYDASVAMCKAESSYYPSGYTINFTSSATGDYSQHFWDFGNGFNSNELNPIHTYAKPGYYEIAYSVIDTVNGCFDTQTKIIFVQGTTGGTTNTSIKADFSYLPGNGTLLVLFKDKSVGEVTNWYWDFGDNTPANNMQNPEYLYSINDYYRVCLTASNSSAQETKCDFIAVGDVSQSSTAYFTYFADSLTATARFKNQSL